MAFWTKGKPKHSLKDPLRTFQGEKMTLYVLLFSDQQNSEISEIYMHVACSHMHGLPTMVGFFLSHKLTKKSTCMQFL